MGSFQLVAGFRKKR